MRLFFSVIIPALNEEKLLPRLLEAINRQTFRDFEVILVDAQSHDETVKIAKEYTNKFPLQIVHTPEKNISRSRNLGAKIAKGEYLVFIDADNYVTSKFLEDMKKVIDRGADMVIPGITPDSRKLVYKMSYSTVNFLVSVSKKIGIPFSTGGNFVIKKSVFELLKGFDEKIFVGEDHDIVGRANRNKVNLAFAKNPKVIFSVRRFEKEGAVVLLKYFISTAYIAFFGKITKKIYNYQMGGDYYKK